MKNNKEQSKRVDESISHEDQSLISERGKMPFATSTQILALVTTILAGGCAATNQNIAPPRKPITNKVETQPGVSSLDKLNIREIRKRLSTYRILLEVYQRLLQANIEKGLEKDPITIICKRKIKEFKGKITLLEAKYAKLYETTEEAKSLQEKIDKTTTRIDENKECMSLIQKRINLLTELEELLKTNPSNKPRIKYIKKQIYENLMQINRLRRCKT